MDKIKILYALSDSASTKIQLQRFLAVAKDYPYNIKIAAFKNANVNCEVDWTLDALLNVKITKALKFNENYSIYSDQIKSFNPDLIISDMEYYSSMIGYELDIPVWQCSASLMNFAISKYSKYKLGLFSNFSYLLNLVDEIPVELNRIIGNSENNFIWSHFCDTENKLEFNNNFKFLRPYFTIGEKSPTCEHNIVAATLDFNKVMLNLLKQHKNTVVFSENSYERYQNIISKNINNFDEYICNIHNSNLFMCGGQTVFLSDAFYNGKFSIIIIDFNDRECIHNSLIAEKLDISKIIYEPDENISSYFNKPVNMKFNSNILFLHEEINKRFKI